MSCSYDVKLANDEGGSENNIKYDMEFLDGVFTHLALVNNPRYERANIVFNSKTVIENYRDDQKRDNKGRWTKEDYNAEIDKIIKGEYQSADRIKVLDKPSQVWLDAGIPEAEMFFTVKTYDKATKSKHNVSETTMRNLPDLISNPKYIFQSSTVKGSFVGVLDDFEQDENRKKPVVAIIKPEKENVDINIIPSVYGKDEDFEYREALKGNLLYERLDNNKTVLNNIVASIATEASKPSIDIIDYLINNFNPNVRESEEMNIQNWNEQDHPRDEQGKFTEKGNHTAKSYYEQEYKEALKEIAEGKDYAQINFNTNISEMKMALAHLKRFDSDWDEYDVYENIKEYEDLSDDWNKEQIGRIAREKAAQETLKKWISEGKDRKNEYYKIYEPHRYKANNNKENEMALLDELKKLITKVENDKGENMDDKEKAENEKVDKREIIREIMAIAAKDNDKFKGGEDEKIRT